MPDRKVYQVEVTIAATAYIRAKSRAEAQKIADEALKDHAVIEVHDAEGDVEVSGLPYDSPDLPDVSLSPAMTITKWGKAQLSDC